MKEVSGELERDDFRSLVVSSEELLLELDCVLFAAFSCQSRAPYMRPVGGEELGLEFELVMESLRSNDAIFSFLSLRGLCVYLFVRRKAFICMYGFWSFWFKEVRVLRNDVQSSFRGFKALAFFGECDVVLFN